MSAGRTLNFAIEIESFLESVSEDTGEDFTLERRVIWEVARRWLQEFERAKHRSSK